MAYTKADRLVCIFFVLSFLLTLLWQVCAIHPEMSGNTAIGTLRLEDGSEYYVGNANFRPRKSPSTVLVVLGFSFLMLIFVCCPDAMLWSPKTDELLVSNTANNQIRRLADSGSSGTNAVFASLGSSVVSGRPA